MVQGASGIYGLGQALVKWGVPQLWRPTWCHSCLTLAEWIPMPQMTVPLVVETHGWDVVAACSRATKLCVPSVQPFGSRMFCMLCCVCRLLTVAACMLSVPPKCLGQCSVCWALYSCALLWPWRGASICIFESGLGMCFFLRQYGR
jgi:hypothetical protein